MVHMRCCWVQIQAMDAAMGTLPQVVSCGGMLAAALFCTLCARLSTHMRMWLTDGT